MSTAEPLMPHPEDPDTAFDERPDAPVPEEHDEPAEADEARTTAGDAHPEEDPVPDFPAR